MERYGKAKATREHRWIISNVCHFSSTLHEPDFSGPRNSTDNQGTRISSRCGWARPRSPCHYTKKSRILDNSTSHIYKRKNPGPFRMQEDQTDETRCVKRRFQEFPLESPHIEIARSERRRRCAR